MARENAKSVGGGVSGRGVIALSALAALLLAGVLFFMSGGGVVFSSKASASPAGILTGGITLVCGSIILLCSMLLGVIGYFFWRSGAAHRKFSRSTDGTVILEFALVFPIALMICLVMAQASLLMGANLCVNYAAYAAARSAIVTIPKETDTEEKNQINASSYSPDGGGADTDKIFRIWSAAVWAAMPISDGSYSASGNNVLTSGLEDFFAGFPEPEWVQDERDNWWVPREIRDDGRNWPPGWINYLKNKYAYACDHTEVYLSEPSGGSEYAAHEDIRVDVTHTFYLSVPYADKIFSALDDGVDLDEGRYGLRIHSTCTLVNQGLEDDIIPEEFYVP